jgi:hypothetical protein
MMTAHDPDKEGCEMMLEKRLISPASSAAICAAATA